MHEATGEGPTFCGVGSLLLCMGLLRPQSGKLRPAPFLFYRVAVLGLRFLYHQTRTAMTPYALHPAFYNQPIRLRPEEMAAPQQVLQEFFEVFPLADTRRLLWLAVEAALSQPHSPFDVAEERQSLLWLYHQLERMLEAGMLLGQAGQERAAMKR